MSIKKLFNPSEKSKNYLSDTTNKEAFSDVESKHNVNEIVSSRKGHTPQVDYSNPANFARYGSAYLYYQTAIEKIHNTYPYDGSHLEKNKFLNEALDIDKYILDNLYPRTNGYARLSNSGWGTRQGAQRDGYGLSDSIEYISFFGGPGTGSYTGSLQNMFPDSSTTARASTNIYDSDIYTTEGLVSDYGVATRESNLKSDFDIGVTVEFWLKKPAFSTSDTEKEIILDIWNNELSSSSDYGRISIALTGGAGSPFVLTAQSGSTGIFEQSIGSDVSTSSLTSWQHYALSFENSGSSFHTKLYINGKLNDSNSVASTINKLQSKNIMGRIGSLITSPSGSSAAAGWGKLSGSLDEFRFWKTSRTPEQIDRNWFSPVYGGSNVDVNNADLGLYYKFNEGISGDSTIDSSVLDYSGRVSNGSWFGYTVGNRSTDSAILESSASSSEFKDPIIYATHPDVVSLKSSLLERGSFHDNNNNGTFSTLLPSWVTEEESESKTTDTKKISHIVGAYFDKLYLQIESLNSIKSPTYTSASHAPYSFASHLPQSMGLYVPEIFIDADVMEKMLNRNNDKLFEGDLEETKNLIYQNLYNNLTHIYKSKGTERSIRNVLRCFNVDERLVRLGVYSDGQTYELKNNLKQTLRNDNLLNFNRSGNVGAVVYQAVSASSQDTGDFISGSLIAGQEDKYGFTMEANVVFPSFLSDSDQVDRNTTTISLFGLNSPDIINRSDTTWQSVDSSNFEVYAIRDDRNSKNVYFKLTSSNDPFPMPELTSSVFFGVYDDERWNISVRLKPDKYPTADIVSGSDDYKYTLEFRGTNTILGAPRNTFMLTASVTQDIGRSFLKGAKRAYIGARRTNVTGALLVSSDVQFSNLKYWTKYIDDSDLNQHAVDIDNKGISKAYRSISPLDPEARRFEITNQNTLALDWNFNNITGSGPSGELYVQDISSGSLDMRNNYGWIGNVVGYQHTGYGYGFDTNSTDVIARIPINSYRFIDPETPIASEMVQILSEDDRLKNIIDDIPSFFYTIEKSMYNAVSEEMLDFFAGAVDFNNVIGEPVNRYRGRYKSLEKLRESFFRRVSVMSDVEKYIEYYKWFDDALATIISQLLPASAELVGNTMNVVESHVLERNKYQNKFPTIEFKPKEPISPMLGLREKLYNWRLNHHPITDNQGTNLPWWLERANREDNSTIDSGVADINTQRDKIRSIVENNNDHSASLLTTSDGTGYYGSTFVLRNLSKPYKVDIIRSKAYGGGTNFDDNKNIHFTYAAVAPAGPVNRDDGVYVPQNVVVAFTTDVAEDNADPHRVIPPNEKKKRFFKTQHGRDWEDGYGYSNVKSSFVFPFNVISSSVISGYNSQVVERVTSSITITNVHNDVYGPDMEKPLQGPFTEATVGGHQSRHIDLNTGTDDYKSRPEAWKILLGQCSSQTGVSGALGMVGPDYPWPEANAVDQNPYPMTASQKAVYFRDHMAKRPVNIRNIEYTTASASPGNFTKNYQVVNTVGGYSNPRQFIENQPTLPSQITDNSFTSQGRTFFDIHRQAPADSILEAIPSADKSDRHFELVPSYSVGYREGTKNKTVIVSRFGAPGGIETMGGYTDIRSGEFSVYNALNYRNLSVQKPSQGPSGSHSESGSIAGTAGIKVYDIHGKDYGLRSHLSRHTARFGRDSVFEIEEGKSYDELPGFHKVHRNNTLKIVPIENESSIEEPQFVGLNSDRGIEFRTLSASAHLQNTKLEHTGAFGGHPSDELRIFTFAGWIKPQDVSADQWIIYLGRSNSGDRSLWIDSSNKLNLKVKHSTTHGEWITDVGINNSQWQHFVISYDSSDNSNDPVFYINGAAVSITENSTPSGTATAISDHQNIGSKKTSTSTLEGSLDEIVIYEVALSASQAATIYNSDNIYDFTASVAPATASLLTWLRMGEHANDPAAPIAGSTHIYDVMDNNEFKVIGANNDAAYDTAVKDVGTTTTRFFYTTYLTSSRNDNFYVQHPIPRSDRQYAWVTNSLADNTDDIRYYGYAPTVGPAAGYYSGSADYSHFFDYVDGSEVTASSNTSLIQPTTRLNILTLDPVGDSDSTGFANSIGVGSSEDNSSYVNTTLTEKLGISASINPATSVGYLNLLLNRRGSTYGWSWNSARSSDHPILEKEKIDNKISIYDDNVIKSYTMSPVSRRGHPLLLNLDIDNENTTLVATYNNRNIFFNTADLDDIVLGTSINQAPPVVDQILAITNASEEFNLKWAVYKETLFPPLKREYQSDLLERKSYDNKMWRSDPDERVRVGSVTVSLNSFGVAVSQSCWPLDAPQGFLTRSGPPTIDVLDGSSLLHLTQSAGELQNCYFHIMTGSARDIPYAQRAVTAKLSASALYARKHCLSNPQSVVAPTGPRIAETGSKTNFYTDHIEKYAGEAMWEAPEQAGIIEIIDGTKTFVSYPSEPWFTDYDAFKYELDVVSKDYAVIPEFRISKHVEDFTVLGLNNDSKQDIFEIPGTSLDSSQDTFYTDYSNSDFMEGFLGIKDKIGLEPSEIKLTCKATMRFNPYKGFYPVQRTLDLISQFSKSYGSGISAYHTDSSTYETRLDGGASGMMRAMYSPGILFNSIKSGIAVDYPITTDGARLKYDWYGIDSEQGDWMITNNYNVANPRISRGYRGGSYWTERVPFEAIIEPGEHISNTTFYSVEPDKSASTLRAVSTLDSAGSDGLYSLMANNFFGEVGNFFLKDNSFTTLESEMVTDDLKFEEGDVYFARLTLARSTQGPRTYQYESGASGDNIYYSHWGGKPGYDPNYYYSDGYFPLPQDPRQNPDFKETFTMYSRPSAFGPPCSGRPSRVGAVTSSAVMASSPVDSMSGFNWSFTPPYTNGEAWVDFIFRPSASVDYDLEKILAETKTVHWRCDPGMSSSWSYYDGSSFQGTPGTRLIATFSGSYNFGSGDASGVNDTGDLIYDGANVNQNAMQISASLNYKGIKRVTRERTQRGVQTSRENETVGMKWIIQPKWETPMLNFADSGIHPITNANNTLSVPTYGSASTPRGMWHQFGTIPESPDVGVFMSIDDIPTTWLQFHYDVIFNDSIYNNFDVSGSIGIHETSKSLLDVVNFKKQNSKARLGEIADKKIIHEAVVAIPYLAADSDSSEENLNYSKEFFTIAREKIEAAMDINQGTVAGDSESAAGQSIRNLVQQHKRYIFPPQFDFVNNKEIDPVAMYVFEFKYELDKDDLSYIWQNLAPRDFKTITHESQCVAHNLSDNEIFSANDLMSNDNIRWMVFKVKQKSVAKYEDMVVSNTDPSPAETVSGYNLQYNWPYDYLSLIELVKFEAEVLYKDTEEENEDG